MSTTILAIESSCDETAVAITRDGELLANIVSTQIEVHAKYGGVMPEIASRLHAENISIVLKEALEKANITSPILPLEFIGLPEKDFNISGTVLEGKINTDKLNSGEEVVLVLPKKLELKTSHYTFTSEDYSFSDINVNDAPSEVSDEKITILNSAELTTEFKVGDKIKIGWIMSNDGKEPLVIE